MKTMQGAFSRACWKRSRTRAGPTPTNISTKSDPDTLKNGTSASPADWVVERSGRNNYANDRIGGEDLWMTSGEEKNIADTHLQQPSPGGSYQYLEDPPTELPADQS